MNIEYKDNTQKFIKSLSFRYGKAKTLSKNALKLGLTDYSSYIQKEQMTGRPGLKVGTGDLRRSWFVTNANNIGNDFSVKLATRSVYARIHQFGGIIKAKTAKYLKFKINGSWISKKQVTIPKRLMVYEEFETKGKDFILDRLNHAISIFTKTK